MVHQRLAAGQPHLGRTVCGARPRQQQPRHSNPGIAQRLKERPAVRLDAYSHAARVLRQGGAKRQFVAVVAVQFGGQTGSAREAGGHRRRLFVHFLQGRHGGTEMGRLGLGGRSFAGQLAAGGLGGRELAGAIALGLGGFVQGGGGSLKSGLGRALGSHRLPGGRPGRFRLRGQVGHTPAEAVQIRLQRGRTLCQARRAHLRGLALGRQAGGFGPALGQRAASGAQLFGRGRVRGLGLLKRRLQAVALGRPGIVGRRRRRLEVGQQPVSLAGAGTGDFVEEQRPLLRKPRAALDPRGQGAQAQGALRATLPLAQRALVAIFFAGPLLGQSDKLGLHALTFGGQTVQLLGKRRQAGVQLAHLAGQHTTTRLVSVALGGAQLLCRRSLSAQRHQQGTDVTFHVQGALQIALRLPQFEQGPLATPLVAAQSGRFFDQRPPVRRLAGQERLHPTLADDGVQLFAQPHATHQLDDIGEAADRMVDSVLGLTVAQHTAHHADLCGRQRQGAVRVVKGELYLCPAPRPASVAAGEDDILHGGAAHGGGALLAESPHDRVGQIALATAVRADDDRHARLEEQLGRLRERLEAPQADGPQVHLGLVLRALAAAEQPHARPSRPVRECLQGGQRLRGGLLLGPLLALAGAAAQRVSVHDRLDLEAAVVRRSALCHQPIGDYAGRARQ